MNMETDAGDPYCSILSFCGIPCFQLHRFASPPPPPPPPLPPPQIPHSDYPLFGPIPDHLLPKYLCLSPTATAAASTVASLEDSCPDITNTALHTSDDLPSSQPEPLSRVSILTSGHRGAGIGTIQKEAPVSCAVSSQDALPQEDEEQAVEEQHHVTAQQHQHPSPVTPMLCVVSYQDSLPSTPELIPEDDFPPSLCYEMADDQLCNNSSLFLSKLKSIAVSSCAPDVNFANFVARFRDASFLLQGQSLSRSMSLLRSELNRGSVSVSHKDKDSPSSAKYFTRSQGKLEDVNADNFGVLTDYPSTRRKRKNLSGKSSSKKQKGSDLLQHGNHPTQNREDDSSNASHGNQIFMKSGNLSCGQPIVPGFQSELGPKKRLLKDSRGPVFKKTKHSSSCSGQDSLTNGSGNIASTHRIMGPSDSYTSLGFQEMVLQALKIIESMNFDDGVSDNTDNNCVTALHDLP